MAKTLGATMMIFGAFVACLGLSPRAMVVLMGSLAVVTGWLVFND